MLKRALDLYCLERSQERWVYLAPIRNQRCLCPSLAVVGRKVDAVIRSDRTWWILIFNFYVIFENDFLNIFSKFRQIDEEEGEGQRRITSKTSTFVTNSTEHKACEDVPGKSIKLIRNELLKIKFKQEILGKTNNLLSFDMTQTA
jgi:hypothetical protein